jgi:predicted RNase H-like nuclease
MQLRNKVVADRSFVAGVDGCPGGWVAFKVSLGSLDIDVEVVDLPAILRDRPRGLAALAIDIPIGLLDVSRACDRAARKLLGRVRGSSVFPASCRAALEATEYRLACEINQQRSGRKLSKQAWCIGPKIKAADDAITPADQDWAFEVHPEVSFWAMNNCRPITHGKKSREGKAERLELLHRLFPRITSESTSSAALLASVSTTFSTRLRQLGRQYVFMRALPGVSVRRNGTSEVWRSRSATRTKG